MDPSCRRQQQIWPAKKTIADPSLLYSVAAHRETTRLFQLSSAGDPAIRPPELHRSSCRCLEMASSRHATTNLPPTQPHARTHQQSCCRRRPSLSLSRSDQRRRPPPTFFLSIHPPPTAKPLGCSSRHQRAISLSDRWRSITPAVAASKLPTNAMPPQIYLLHMPEPASIHAADVAHPLSLALALTFSVNRN
ncbi:hypothetical protein FXO37_29527 [Capsicum annuum]|nr:hypothetical protein FXO37_29527 [Capsicum annuum]